MFYKYPISDAHIHAFDLKAAHETLDMVEELGYEKFVMLSGSSIFPEFMGNNLLNAYVKLASKGRGYAFAAVHYPEKGVPTAQDMLEQVKLYYDLGFDGMKMMDGKPIMRKTNGLPLNDPVYDPMFDYMEEKNMPILYHVNDPYEFWHKDLMPDWAKKDMDRLFYGGGDYPTKQEIEEEAVGIMDKHPNLKIIFAHFFFTANNMERTKYLFDKYPNMYYDITPGWEMFESFAQDDYKGWRQFFKDYSHRIIFGTDTISGHWRETVSGLRRVMETDEEFVAFEENCKGLNLDKETLENIYNNTFKRFIGAEPKTMDIKGLINYGESLYNRAASLETYSKDNAAANIDEALTAIKGI